MSKDITLANISTVNVGAALDLYQQNLAKLPSLNKHIATYQRELTDLLKQADNAKDLEGVDPCYGYDKLVIYAKPKEAKSGELDQLVSEEGYMFAGLAGNRLVMNYIKKNFGKDVSKFVETVGGMYEQESYGKSKLEVNSTLTAELHKKIKKVVGNLISAEDELKEIVSSIDNFERYMGTLEKVSSTTSNLRG